MKKVDKKITALILAYFLRFTDLLALEVWRVYVVNKPFVAYDLMSPFPLYIAPYCVLLYKILSNDHEKPVLKKGHL
jgi:hypothetical protein